MEQNYIVFTENKKLIFGSYEHHPCDSSILNENPASSECWDFIKNQSDDELLVSVSFDRWKLNFRIIKAAGGIVTNNNALLMIYRNNFWDLPKGWIEDGEFAMQAAIREVLEECGDLSLIVEDIRPIISYHLYLLKGSLVLKETYWYKMQCADYFNLKPQRSEGIKKVEFVSPNLMSEYMQKAYPMIQWVWSKTNI
jgi:8-oxo-dGTP pyrophosphatase MutT (NUDIX family)